jgi:hypothetical protein
MDIDVICLSSDDEEEQLALAVVTPPNNKVPAIKRGKNGVRVSRSTESNNDSRPKRQTKITSFYGFSNQL